MWEDERKTDGSARLPDKCGVHGAGLGREARVVWMKRETEAKVARRWRFRILDAELRNRTALDLATEVK